jgi:hypothetical protein
MRFSRGNFWATFAGFVLMLVGLLNSLVTLATRDYRGALATALGCAVLGVACLAVPIVRGPRAWRVIAAVVASPAVFIVLDFARRAPSVFGRG